MKTKEQVLSLYKQQTLDRRDIFNLAQYLTEDEFITFGLELKEKKGQHVPKTWTRENILDDLKQDVDFGFEKALNQRGLSSSFQYTVVKMWNWILEEGLENFNGGYAQYGLPLFKAAAIKYGFDNPIGSDTGTEACYASPD